MKHPPVRLTASLAGILALMSPLALNAADDQAKTSSLKLKLTALPIAGQALTASDLDNGTMPMTTTAGTVIPKSTFTLNKTHDLSVLDSSFHFVNENKNLQLSLQNKPAVRLPAQRDGVIDVPILSAAKGTLLSLPIVFPTKTGFTVHYRSGSVAQSKIKGEGLYIYDDNFDGSFTTTNDMISVGSGVVFAPINKYLPTAGGLVEIVSVAADGSALDYVESTEETGKLDVKYSYSQATAHVVFKGPNGISVIGSGAKAQVTLPGEYHLAYGLVLNPRTGMTYAGVIPGASETISVKANETTKLAFGGPFTGEAAISVSPANGNKPKSINIAWPPFRNLRGSGGEYYVNYRLKGNMANVFLDGKPSGNVSPPC